MCLYCLKRLTQPSCPMCRKEVRTAFDFLPDAYYLLGLIEEERGEQRTQGAAVRKWCVDCNAAATPECLKEHGVMNAKAALRRRVQDAVRNVDARGLAEDLGGCGEEQALAALRLLSGDAADWSLSLRREDTVLSARWRQDGDASLFHALAAILAVRCGLQEGAGPLRNARQCPCRLSQGSGPPDAPTPGVAERAPEGHALELDMAELTLTGSNLGQDEKEALRQRAVGVRRLRRVWCHEDPDWTLRVLRGSSPTVEEVLLVFPRNEHVSALHAMPRLRRLFVYDGQSVDAAFTVPALPETQERLHTLEVHRLPRRPLLALLRAHGPALHTLQLWVGTKGCTQWPYSCNDLHRLLGRSCLPALRKLLLRRWVGHHKRQDCEDQRGALRRALPWAQVHCEWCDNVPPEAF